MIERDFDVPFVADLALREKQIQQNYRPIMAVHKWFARRPGTLFRALILSEFIEKPLRESFYQGQSLIGLKVLDPFMGGGTTLVEANRVGCAVTGFDINPMAWWIVRQEIGELDLDAYRRAADELRTALETELGTLYRTRCLECGAKDAHVKYFLWVKSIPCNACKGSVDLFPNYLLAEDVRQQRYQVVACIAGRGFGVRREDMKKMLLATRGKVFTLKTLDRLVECSDLRHFKTRKRTPTSPNCSILTRRTSSPGGTATFPTSPGACKSSSIDGRGFFPDFVVGVAERKRWDGVLLTDPKFAFEISAEAPKTQAEHPIYGRVLILHRQGGAQWMTVRYDERLQKPVLDREFRLADAPGY